MASQESHHTFALSSKLPLTRKRTNQSDFFFLYASTNQSHISVYARNCCLLAFFLPALCCAKCHRHITNRNVKHVMLVLLLAQLLLLLLVLISLFPLRGFPCAVIVLRTHEWNRFRATRLCTNEVFPTFEGTGEMGISIKYL